MDMAQLKSVIVYQKERFLKSQKIVQREILQHKENIIQSKEIIVISGVRRSGKSTLLKLIAEYLLSEQITSKNNFLYINFEDPKLYNFSLENCQLLYEIFIENTNNEDKKFLFFDEIQNVTNWERRLI